MPRRFHEVAPWLSHEGLANGEGGRSHELVPPGAVLRQVCPLGEHRREVEVPLAPQAIAL